MQGQAAYWAGEVTQLSTVQAALGAEITVPAAQGQEKIKIPAGTQSGAIFRQRGKGMPHLQRNGAGDLLVIVNVLMTVRRRTEKLLYVSVWYACGALLWTFVVYSFGNVIWDPLGALRGRYINVLVADADTAQWVIDHG